MAETKRRNRTEGTGETDGGSAPPRRQTRVTLSKDVSSRYRKIMPKSPAGQAAGAGRPRRKPDESGASAPPARTPKAAGGRAFAQGQRGSGPGGRGPGAGGRSGAPARRPAPGGPGRSRGGPSPAARRYDREAGGRAELEMKAIINRELPEAARQVRETQALILSSAEEILALAESLEGIHQELDQALSRFAQENRLLEAGLSPLSLRLQEARSKVTTIYEKMSFQDLAGQRLSKVENFCVALGTVLNRAPAGRGAAPGRASAGPGRDRKSPWKATGREGQAPARSREPKAPAKAAGRLKGPQADGQGLGQNDIDRLLSGL